MRGIVRGGLNDGLSLVIAGQTEANYKLAGATNKYDPIIVQCLKPKVTESPSFVQNYGDFSLGDLFYAVAANLTPFIKWFPFAADAFGAELAAPAVLPTGQGNGCKWSPSGIYLAVTHEVSPQVTIYKRTGNTLTKLANPTTLPGLHGQRASWYTDDYLAVTSTNGGLIIYKRSGDTFVPLAAPTGALISSPNGVAFSPDGNFIAIGTGGGPFIAICSRTGDVFARLSDPAILPSGLVSDVSWSPDSNYLALSSNSSPFIMVYKRNGNVFTKLADLPQLPVAAANAVYFSPLYDLLATCSSSTDDATAVYLYKRTGDKFSRLISPSPLPSGFQTFIGFSKTGNYIYLNPKSYVYKLSLSAIVETLMGSANGQYSSGYAKQAGAANEIIPIVELFK